MAEGGVGSSVVAVAGAGVLGGVGHGQDRTRNVEWVVALGEVWPLAG